MATSGTYTFNLDIAEIIEEAYDRCGLEIRGGYDLRSTRRSLDLMLLEWSNRGVNLWTVDQATVTMVDGTNTYTLDSQWSDVMDAVMRDTSGTSNVDTTMERLSMSEYLQYPTKSTPGDPVEYTIERNSTGGHTLYVYPTPDDSTHEFVMWGIRYTQDAGDYTDNPDVPRRFLPALVSGLAYWVAVKNPAKYSQDPGGQPVLIGGVDNQKRAELKAVYEEEFEAAKFEDHERSSLYVVPDISLTYPR